MRRILFISHEASRSGAPMVLLHLLRWLKAHTDWRLGVVLPADGPLRADYAAQAPIVVLTSGPSSNAEITESLLGGPPDLVYCNSATSVGILDRLERFSCPVLIHVHELEYALLHTGVPQLVEKMNRHATHFLACAQIVKDNLIVRHWLAAERISVVHEFIATDQTAPSDAATADLPSALGIPPGALIVGAMGMVEWRKGADRLVPLARMVVDRQPDLPIYFVWVGGGDKSNRAQLRYDIEAAGLSERVKLVGQTDNPQAWHKAFGVLALLSSEDPFPLVCLEAAAQGVPTVCFAGAGGITEFIDKDCGVVVPFLDLPAVAHAIVRYAVDPALRWRAGAAAAKKVRARHDVAVAAPQIAELIQRLTVG